MSDSDEESDGSLFDDSEESDDGMRYSQKENILLEMSDSEKGSDSEEELLGLGETRAETNF